MPGISFLDRLQEENTEGRRCSFHYPRVSAHMRKNVSKKLYGTEKEEDRKRSGAFQLFSKFF